MMLLPCESVTVALGVNTRRHQPEARGDETMPCVGPRTPEPKSRPTLAKWCHRNPFTLAGIAVVLGMVMGWLATGGV